MLIPNLNSFPRCASTQPPIQSSDMGLGVGRRERRRRWKYFSCDVAFWSIAMHPIIMHMPYHNNRNASDNFETWPDIQSELSTSAIAHASAYITNRASLNITMASTLKW